MRCPRFGELHEQVRCSVAAARETLSGLPGRKA